MTKVLSGWWPRFPLALCLLAAGANGQTVPGPGIQGPAVERGDCPRTAEALYSRLRSVGLDRQRVYHIRGASIDRPNLHLSFDDGTLAFTEDVCGRVTGAFFEGDGEVLLRPPNHVERESLALFTESAILEEQFTSGYLRFNDDTFSLLQPFLSPATDGSDFLKTWGEASHNLAETDALRLLLDFSHFLPVAGGTEPPREFPRFLHAHLSGKMLGGFEVNWDVSASEPLWSGQVRVRDDLRFFDIWTSFVPNASAAVRGEALAGEAATTSFRIRTTVQPPTRLRASAELKVRIRNGGERMLIFELSRYLKIDGIQQDGHPLEFLQNQALDGTQLRRKGNDLVAVIFPAPLRPAEELNLRFSYEGDVLSEAGNGLLYVGERGTWYPSFGLSPAQFDLEFEFPLGWTMVATGKAVAPEPGRETAPAGTQVARWISERPIAVAGFNLGKYTRADAKSGSILVQAYGTSGVERSFPKARSEVVDSGPPGFPRALAPPAMVITPSAPSPAHNVQAVADTAANAIDSFSKWFGPFPYGSLSLTQMPGELSQGWPGLVFLSSYAFLSPREQSDLHLDPVNALLSSQVLVHETAHQWWGDLVLWKSYRDQWIVEGLANYSAMLVLEQRNPAQFREAMERYRSDLLVKNKDGEPMRAAGPVTLGQRLVSSHFPGGYEAISYERGTWLFHMLRCMLRDAEAASHSRNGRTDPDEPFFRALRKLRDRYAGKSVSTQELIKVFEEDLPRSLWYERRRSLDWFFEGWINGTAMPRLEARDIKIVPREKGSLVTGTIEQKDAPDDLVTAIPVYAQTASNAQVLLGIVLADGPETPFRLSAPATARKILLDPRQTVLTTLK